MEVNKEEKCKFNVTDSIEFEESKAADSIENNLFVCAICDEAFSSLNILERHVNSHTKNQETSLDEFPRSDISERPFKCKLCQKSFGVCYYLKLHLRSHTGEKPYQCHLCGKAFITCSKLSRHIVCHSGVKNYQCRVCHKFYTRFSYLKVHFNNKHLEMKLPNETYAIFHNGITREEKPQDIPDIIKNIPHILPKLFSSSPSTEPLDIYKNLLGNEDQIKVEKWNMECLDYSLMTLTGNAEAKHEEYSSCSLDINTETTSKDEKSNNNDLENAYKCNICQVKYTYVSDLYQHVKNHKKKSVCNDFERPIQCLICDKSFTLAYLKIHARTHTGDKPYVCKLCGRGFITSSKLHRHLMTHEDHTSMETEVALNSTEEEKPIEEVEHLEVKIEPNEMYGDEGSDLDPSKTDDKHPQGSESSESSQIKKNDIKEIEKCLEECDKIIEETKRKHKKFCKYCGKGFTFDISYYKHLRKHGDNTSFMCKYCFDKFDDEGKYTKHIEAHTGETPYKCNVCQRCYTESDSLKHHLKLHRLENNFKCDVCGKAFMTVCRLKRHLVVHDPEKFTVQYECPVCANIFKTKYHVEKHLITHEKEGLIVKENRSTVLALAIHNARKIAINTENENVGTLCYLCGERFSNSSMYKHQCTLNGKVCTSGFLQKPMELNNPEEPEGNFECNICQKRFKVKWNLKLHMRIHTNERPYQCHLCGKSFITTSKLQRHVDIHSSEKKYKCPVCSKYFHRASYIRTHMKLHSDYPLCLV